MGFIDEMRRDSMGKLEVSMKGDLFFAQVVATSQEKTDSPVFKLYFLEKKD